MRGSRKESQHSEVSVSMVTLLLRGSAFSPTRPIYSVDCGCSIPPCQMLKNLRLLSLHLCASKFSGKEPWLDWILQVPICGLRSEVRLTTWFPGAARKEQGRKHRWEFCEKYQLSWYIDRDRDRYVKEHSYPCNHFSLCKSPINPQNRLTPTQTTLVIT